MRAISFGWTWPALVTKNKTCTRRDWDPRYARSFKSGECLQALNKVWFQGGKRIGVIRLIEKPYLQNLADMPAADYRNEGFEWFFCNPSAIPRKGDGVNVIRDGSLAAFRMWRETKQFVWVVRFKILDIEKFANDDLLEFMSKNRADGGCTWPSLR